ncbi:protein Gawky-like isoform X2 [Uranotaenia lowii]|uniref:protein Gawky-like isoform X2 n=1 Tax=Uranotaenia lowii TaxID=190385 RepID=UPI00247A01CD|nr:protein Gawky-like isoform X2 [Uranotaenia lowii]
MKKSSTKSSTVAMFRLRSDRFSSGDNIPLVFHRQMNGDISLQIDGNSKSIIRSMAVPFSNKSDFIYSTQSSDESEFVRMQMLVEQFPIENPDVAKALVSHIIELMRTTNSVTLKCDLNAYLNNISISRNLSIKECSTQSRAEATTVIPVSHRRHGSYTKFDDLLILVANEKSLLKRAQVESQGRLLPRLRLCGGGEDSINNGTSAWGTPPGAASGSSAWGIPNQQPPPSAWGGTGGNVNNTNNINNNNNQPATSQSQRQQQPSQQSQDQNANKAPQPIPNTTNSPPNAWNRNPPSSVGPNPNIANNNNQQPPSQQQPQPPQQQQQQPQLVLANNGNVAAKSQLEQLSNLREALFSQDGWGCQHVNQDTNWEVPGSPEPGKPEQNNAAGGPPNPAATNWKPCTQNNGTELWEANLRNGGQPPPQPPQIQKAPWGPSTNIGGTWGEDDDSAEANVWNGGPVANQQAAVPQAWGQANPPMWPPGAGPNPAVVKKENDWAPVGVIGGSSGTAPPLPPTVSSWDTRSGSVPAVNIPGPIGQNTPIDAAREIRGDPRGISGRLNGNVGMWDQSNVPNMQNASTKMPQSAIPAPAVPGLGNQWNTPVPNKLPGWDDTPSPMAPRPSVDEGPTALWNQGPLSRQNSNISNWKDMSENIARNPMARAPLGGGNNLPLGPVNRAVRLGGMNPGMKPDNSMWGQNPGLPLNGSWEEPTVNSWEDKGIGNSGPWNDFGQNNLWNKSKQSASGWPDSNDMMGGGSGNDWTMNKPPNKMSPAEFIRSSKQYRMLCENGFKKEDVELALRSTNMNFEESLDLLQRHGGGGALNDWRRPDDHPNNAFDAPFSNRFPSGHGGGMPFSQGPSGHSSFSQGPNPLVAAAAGGGNPQNLQAQPSTQQLRMLVQQIQMAVHAGFLNHQILNQPLAPQTLLLLNQLLNHIRQMQHIQSNLARSGGATGVSTVQLTMQINKHKAQISQLQQQIAAQQANYVKQQQQQHQLGGPHQPPGTPGGISSGLGGADFLRQQDLVALQNNFADMALGKEPVTPTGVFPAGAAAAAAGVNPTAAGGAPSVTSQQSRLNQWKLPSLDKDNGAGGSNDLTDFSRAPGTTAKSTLSTTSSNIGSLGLQDGTWSSGRSNLADGWPDQSSGESGNKEWAPAQDNAAFSDLVPEFEPGKPWKGTQMKIEEDPSITPGSVARGPLSLVTAKETDLFGVPGGKTSPNDGMGLASSTWSFNASQSSSKMVGGTNVSKAGAGGWPENMTSSATPGSSSDLWGNTMGKTTRGPPPGLGANKNAAAANGWSGAGTGAQRPGNNWSSGNGWGSTWLLLKNLTSQIDGATLRTLCMQHGPLLSLQLFSNHGLALCKYSSREEANKAQQALNNCSLGSTTIGAESPSETEVQGYLQQLGVPTANVPLGGGGNVLPPPSSSSSSNVTSVSQSWRHTPRSGGADTWGSGWPPSSTGGGSNLWAPLEGGTERGTPSNLNSFLPESLLGTELN